MSDEIREIKDRAQEGLASPVDSQTDLAKRLCASILSVGKHHAEDRSRETTRVALVAAADILCTGPEAGFGQPQRQYRQAIRRAQLQRLIEAARVQTIGSLQVASEGEHRVYHDETTGQALKETNNGRYGMVLDQEEVGSQRRLELRAALPSEYFWRLGIQNVVFGDWIRIEAITANPYGPPAIQTSQPWLPGEKPSMQEIVEFMVDQGFRQLPRAMLVPGVVSILSWYRPTDQILVYDTKDINFVRCGETIAPIDLCLGICPQAILEETAHLNGVDWQAVMQPGA